MEWIAACVLGLGSIGMMIVTVGVAKVAGLIGIEEEDDGNNTAGTPTGDITPLNRKHYSA